MKQTEIKEYFRNKEDVFNNEKMLDTIEGCKVIMRSEKQRMPYHMGFIEFLSDTFHRDGASLIGIQVIVLILSCFIIRELRDIPNLLPLFIPLFILATIPVLFKADFYHMGEMEAVTLHSNITLFLARLTIILLTDLFCFTLLLFMDAKHINSVQNLFNTIIYVLVPYTFCIGVLLFFARKKGSKGYKNCILTIVICSIFLGITAIYFPFVYNISSIGLWIIFLVLFAFFLFKEVRFLFEFLKEGHIYGVIS